MARTPATHLRAHLNERLRGWNLQLDFREPAHRVSLLTSWAGWFAAHGSVNADAPPPRAPK